MNITITLKQFNKMRRLSDFARYYIEEREPSGEQYHSDNADINEGLDVLQDINDLIYYQTEQAERSARTDAWIKQANQDIREGRA
jgi:hypothetical protein